MAGAPESAEPSPSHGRRVSSVTSVASGETWSESVAPLLHWAAAAGETSHGATGRSLPPIQSSISMPLVTGHSMGKTVGKQGGLSYNHSYVQPTQERSSGYGKPKAGKYGRGPMPLGQQRGHASKPMPAAGMGMGNPGGTSSRYKSKVSSKYISPYSQKAQRAARQGG